MGSKLGRNEGCPCGSGRKYKRCCLAREAAGTVGERYARQKMMMRGVSERLMQWSLGGAFAGCGPKAVKAFYGEPRGAEVADDDMQLFVPYLLWKWKPGGGGGSAERPALGVAESFLRAHGAELTGAEREYVEQAIAEPLRFLEVVEVEAGVGFVARDILTQREAEVQETTASRALQANDVIFAQWVCVEGIYSIEGFGTVPLPPAYKVEVVKLRRALERAIGGRRLGEADLEGFADALRESYLGMVESLRMPPRLSNTDGEMLELHTLRYRLELPPGAAFAALASLARGRSRAELLEEAERDADGEVVAVEIPWMKLGNKMHKSWDNTILGHLALRSGTLEAEVNSAGRAKRLRALIERRLGAAAVLESEERRSAEALMAEAASESRRGAREDELISAGSRERPAEMRAMERAAEEAHAVEWLDAALPVLDGHSPREAVREADGREMVEALLADWERRGTTGVEIVRRELGLAPEG